MNWAPETDCYEIPAAFPWPEDIESLFEFVASSEEFKLLSPDEKRGEQGYMDFGCYACHGMLQNPGSASVGPWLGNLKFISDTRVEDQSLANYVYQSILFPNEYIAPNCAQGSCTEPSLMPASYGYLLSGYPTDLIDLIAYLIGNENLPLPVGNGD